MNPILQMINNASTIEPLVNLLNKQDASQLCKQMMANNPQFKDFVEKNKGKSADEIAKAYGVDISAFKNLLK